jgi:hypothetical protein
MARFEDLDVWQRAVRLSGDLYKALSALNDFGFREQITKAGINKETGARWLREAEEISRMLHGLIRSVRSRKT